MNTELEFESKPDWTGDLPIAIVVACCDGRTQRYLDECLAPYIGTSNYDRLYIPGGPGAFAKGETDEQRARSLSLWEELKFMIQAHKLNRVVLIFHGAEPGGPRPAQCGDYGRIYPELDRDRVSERQRNDANEVKNAILKTFSRVQVDILSLGVTEDQKVVIRSV